MVVETQIQQIQENPEIEAYRLGLLSDVTDFIRENLTGSRCPHPSSRFSGCGPHTASATGGVFGTQGVGHISLICRFRRHARGETATETYGLSGVDEGLAAGRAGLGALMGTGMAFDPNQTSAFMNPYEDAVVEQAMRDIDRGSQAQRQQLGARAAAAGAFGGSRQAVAEGELNRALAEQKARTAGQLRASGFQQAQAQAQQAFEAAQRRRQQQAQLAGALGQGLGSLGAQGAQVGSQLSQLGLQQAGLGQLQQQLNLGDVKTLEANRRTGSGPATASFGSSTPEQPAITAVPVSTICFLERRVQGNAFVTAGDSNNTNTRPVYLPADRWFGYCRIKRRRCAKALNLF